MGINFRLKLAAFLFAFVLFIPVSASAQTGYPTKPIKLIVPFAAGGTTDIVARLLGQQMKKLIDATVVIENVSGAAAIIGTERAAKSAPDGYTLLLASSAPFATNPNFYTTLPYSISDFAPIILIARVPLMLDVHPKFPASNVKEFIAYAKSKPDGVTIATPGRGSLGEIVNGQTRGILGIPVTNVPYRGGAPAVADVLTGSVDAYYDAISSSLGHYRGGTLKALAITGRKRSPAAPDVPTMVELGYPDFICENLYALLAPKGTPRPIIDKLNEVLRRAMADPEFRNVLIEQGVVPEPSTPEELAIAIKEDYEFNARIVKQFNIPPVQ